MARAFVFVVAGFGGGYFVVFRFGICRDGSAVGEFGIGRFCRKGVYGFGIAAAVSFGDPVFGKCGKMKDNFDSCSFCRSGVLPGLPCLFCAGNKLRKVRQKAAGLLLRRMGFAARDSFDLQCAVLKAAANNQSAKAKTKGGFDNDNKTASAEAGNHSAFDNASCPRRLATMAVAFLADGVDVVGREEFDAHCQILAAAEAQKAAKTKTKQSRDKVK